MADNKDASEPEKSPTNIKTNPRETTMEESSEEPTRVQPLSKGEEFSKEPEKSPTSIKRNPSETTMEESSEEPTKVQPLSKGFHLSKEEFSKEPEKSPTSIKGNPSETTMEESSKEPRTRVQPLSRETPVGKPSKTPPKSPRIRVRLPEVVHLGMEESCKEPKKKSPTIIKRNSGSLTMEDSPKEPKKKKTVHNPDFNAGDDDDSCTAD